MNGSNFRLLGGKTFADKVSRANRFTSSAFDLKRNIDEAMKNKAFMIKNASVKKPN